MCVECEKKMVVLGKKKPTKRENVPEIVPANPVLQTGVHVVPLVESARQSPAAPFWTEGTPGQGTESHLPEIDQAPETHSAVTVPTNPVLQLGLQRVPEKSFRNG